MAVEPALELLESEPLRVFLNAGEQVVDLACCFLADNTTGYYSCKRDFCGEDLLSCEDCHGYPFFVKPKGMINH
ncbi:MAG: hypothetical protein ACFFD4_15365 [Candidatus Odinarchaeota archaeon]